MSVLEYHHHLTGLPIPSDRKQGQSRSLKESVSILENRIFSESNLVQEKYSRIYFLIYMLVIYVVIPYEAEIHYFKLKRMLLEISPKRIYFPFIYYFSKSL